MADWFPAEAGWQQAVAGGQQAVVGWLQAVAGWQQAVAGWFLAEADWRQQAVAGWQQAVADWQQAVAGWQQAVAGWSLAREEGWQEPLLAPLWWWQVAAAAAWGAAGLRPPWLGEGRVVAGDVGATAAAGAAKVAADCRAQQIRGRPQSRVSFHQGDTHSNDPTPPGTRTSVLLAKDCGAEAQGPCCASCMHAVDAGGARTEVLLPAWRTQLV